MPFTNYAVEAFISRRIVELTTVGVTDLSPEFPNSSSWLSRLGMLSVLTNQFSPETRPFAIQFVRKVEMSLAEYARAKPELEALVARTGRWSPYYRALHHVETSSSLLYQAYDLSRKKLGIALFQPGDGSSLQRLNGIYNKARHEPAAQDDPVWLSNTSIHTSDVDLRFSEYESMLREYSNIAEKITSSQGPSPATAADA
jgi:hypothetical protein